METREEQIARMRETLAAIKARKAAEIIKRDAIGAYIDRNARRYYFPKTVMQIFCNLDPDTGRYFAR